MRASRTAKLYRSIFGVKVACLIGLMAPHTVPEEVTVYRDGWGIPHIYGTTDRAAAFGYGYAQAHDRTKAVIRNLSLGSGRLAESVGEEAVPLDFQQRLWGHREAAQTALQKAPPAVRDWVTAFSAGIDHYLTSSSQADSSGVVSPDHIAAFTRYIFWRGILRHLDQEHGRSDDTPVGALWGLGPERSTADATTIVADPYESWSDGTRWYEAHLHGASIHAWGYTYPGMPLPVFAHNRKLGWGWLPTGPDVGDVYRIAFESEGSFRYRWDGRTRTAEADTFHLQVKDADTVVLTGLHTHLGPIIHREGRVGYAYRVSDGTASGQVDQLYRMVTSETFESFYTALRAAQLGPSTILFGDTSGSLFYIQSGSVPIRPESIDWRRPISTDMDIDWVGTHKQEDLIQLLDPSAGWVLDAETSPDRVTPYAPLVPDRFPGYIFDSVPGRESSRSARLRSLIVNAPRISVNEIFDISMDTHVIGSERWLRALHLSVATLDPELSKDEQSCLSMLQEWDGRAEPDSFGPALYLSWRTACEGKRREIDDRSVRQYAKLSIETMRTLISAFKVAVENHKQTYGHLDVRWREVHRARRGGKSWGIPGMSHRFGQTIRNIEVSRENVVAYGKGGQTAPTVMVFAPSGIQTYTSAPYGQSDSVGSPHHWDQGEVLCTQNKLRPTRFDTKRGLTQKEVLRIPEDLFK